MPQPFLLRSFFLGILSASACISDDSTPYPTRPPADAGRIDMLDAKNSGNDAGEAGPTLCGYAGEPCCKAPLASCGEGNTCKSETCTVKSIRAVGFQREDAPSSPITGVSLFFDGNEWTFDPDLEIPSQRNNLPIGVWASSGEYRVITNNSDFGKGDLWLRSTNEWLLCSGTSTNCGRTEPPQLLGSLFGFSATDFWLSGSEAVYSCNGGGICAKKATGLPATLGPGNLTGTSSSDLWLSQDSAAYHFDGSMWTKYSGVPARVIWAASPNDVWAGGSTIRHFDGTIWSTPYVLPGLNPGDNVTITSISGSASNNVWIAGYRTTPTSTGATALTQHWDGMQWLNTPLPDPVDVYLQTIWAPSSREVFAAGRQKLGAQDAIHKWDGSVWNSQPIPRRMLPTQFTSLTGLARPRP
jgi:hypothetical protein